MEVSHPETESSKITVFLGDERAAHERSSRRLHSLGPPATSSEALAPEEVQSVTLDSVSLHMSIDRPLATGHRKLKRRRIDSQRLSNASKSIYPQEVDAQNQSQTAPQLKQISTAPGVRAVSGLLGVIGDESDSDLDLEIDERDIISGPTSYDKLNAMKGQSTTIKPPSLLKRSSSTSSLGQDAKSIDNDEILELVDTALRMAVSGSSKPSNEKIKLVEVNSSKYLEDVCPSLWSPGYLPAVSSRVVFLPTISHALDSVCTRRLETYGLRNNIRSMNHSTSSISDQQRDVAAHTKTRSRTLLNLWRVLERALYQPGAGKHLQPLSVPASLAFSESESSQSMLYLAHRGESYAAVDSTLDELLNEEDSSHESDWEMEERQDRGWIDECWEHQHILSSISGISEYAGFIAIDEALELEPVAWKCRKPNERTGNLDLLNDDLLSICESMRSTPLEEEYVEGLGHDRFIGGEPSSEAMLVI